MHSCIRQLAYIQYSNTPIVSVAGNHALILVLCRLCSKLKFHLIVAFVIYVIACRIGTKKC